ncbi:MAG: zinc dependent phospholipase C family protein [Saprospiraceae bacterium]
MNHHPRSVLLILLLGATGALLATALAPPWGFYAHRKINRQAVFTLPPEMTVFYKKNIEYLTEHAVDPDMRRYATRHEAPRHFMDLDRYGEPPFPTLPRHWADALAQFSEYYFINEKNDTLPVFKRGPEGHLYLEDSLVFFEKTGQSLPYDTLLGFFKSDILPQYYEDNWVVDCGVFSARFGSVLPRCNGIFVVDKLSGHGILPYHLNKMLNSLKYAFIEQDAKKILRLSADFGHYVADAHVPLHTSQNYNGQLSGQDGIHAFWETRLPELFAEDTYDFWVGKASLIEKPQDYFWGIVLKSHSYVDSVLGIEKDLRKQFPPDRQFCNEMRGDVLVKTQCEDFAKAYSDRMGSMVEDRMRAAIVATGSAWYTAWVLAGQPDLRSLANPGSEEDEEQKELEQAVKSGKLLGRPHE